MAKSVRRESIFEKAKRGTGPLARVKNKKSFFGFLSRFKRKKKKLKLKGKDPKTGKKIELNF